MTMSSALELQKAIFAVLADDSSLSGLLGGPKIYDLAPPAAHFPYVTFGRTSVHDWSTGTEIGTEHIFTIHVWSKGRGKAEALAIMAAISQRLAGSSLDLAGHRLVNLQLEYSEVRHDDDLALHHGLLRYRATVEQPAA
jgi:hypothetical protein